ncbi:probable sugar ABC transporter, permease protein [Thermoplasma acidophilum]|uniref:Probable sugar ABC transporter, permease protein n=1 Tax=Thermoplasma acidophilum (strain ATCC 25905 / DSM 1728 / JCM 9062 / NBRC 15155 / AMRC-C165) TaxID=273075 RepID=Q9HKB2_THEAC|nr:carbohydrate ABC transporter permease [Thermoplasma acidophilum]CAC11827.1 probable sugar ABC transporter, permease protein [Thermoplasma acidophilum]
MLRTEFRRRRRISAGESVKTYLIYVVSILLAIVYLVPFYWTVIKAFRDSIFANFPPNMNPFSQTSISYFIVNLRTVWGFGDFPLWYFNSVFVSICVVAGSVFVGMLAGYAFARLKFPGRDYMFYAVLATLMIPFPVISIASYVFMLDLNWLSTYQGLILPQIASALDVFIMRQYFLTIPEEVELAAKIDGMKPWQIFFRVSAPMAKPAIAAATIFSFIGSWNNFLWPLMEVHSLNMFTLPLVLNFFKGANGTQIYWNQMMTVNILTMIPTIVIFVVFEKYFISGISMNYSR